MITNAGRLLILKNMVRANCPISAIGVGNGGEDPFLHVPIAPTPDAVSLKNLIFFEESIQNLEPIAPPTGDVPRLLLRHSFFAKAVSPSGTAVNYLNEVGLFVKDPDTKLWVLVWVKTFPNKKFRVPASGAAVAPDVVTIKSEVFS